MIIKIENLVLIINSYKDFTKKISLTILKNHIILNNIVNNFEILNYFIIYM
jgi:hypothetical protein